MGSRSTCRLDPVLDCISEPWTLAIIHQLSTGPRRTVELFGAFDGMGTQTLTVRLKKLEREGIVSRRSFPESPPRVEYSLTAKGRMLLPVLSAAAAAADQWIPAEAEPESTDLTCEACEMAGFVDLQRPRMTIPGDAQPDVAGEAPLVVRRRTRDVTLL